MTDSRVTPAGTIVQFALVNARTHPIRMLAADRAGRYSERSSRSARIRS